MEDIQMLKRVFAYSAFLGINVAMLACGGQPTPYTRLNRLLSFESDPYLASIANDFIHRCDELGKECSRKAREFPQLVIKWDNRVDLKTAIAQCQIFNLGKNNAYKRIILVHPHAETYTQDELKSIVAHEVSHCVLYKDHTSEDEIRLMRPISLNQQEIDSVGGIDVVIDRGILDEDIPSF
jgi:Zn-dependent protease with chaperone function